VSKTTWDVSALAAPGVWGLEPYQPGKPLAELEREYGVRNAVKLASNENPLGAGSKAVQAATQALKHIERYPDGSGFTLKRAIASRHDVSPEQITLGNGSNEVLELVARAFVVPGNEIVFSQHAFAVYPIVTQAVGATAVVTSTRDYGCDLQSMRRALSDRTRVIFLANPNNPTGTWLASVELEAFIQDLPETVLIVVDEAYAEYVTETDYPNTIPWIGRYSNLIVTRTFSKIHGLAGLRIGYGVSSLAVAEILNRVRQPFNVNSPALAAAEASLTDDTHVKRSVQMNSEGMRQLTQGLDELGLTYIRSVANFICVDLGRPAAPVHENLLRRGVIVRPIANYGLPNHLRVTVGSPKENTFFLEALAYVIRDS
jgi:histidinol-phosphate aminotransferase